VLDQILVSRELSRGRHRYDVVHVNSEFADQASDHDPSVARFSFDHGGADDDGDGGDGDGEEEEEEEDD
jgi:hypothetical protein